MGDHDDCGAASVDLLQQLHDSSRHLGVQIACWLIRQQEPRAASQRSRDGCALLLSTRQCSRKVMHPGAEADTLQYADDSFSALFHAESAIPQGHIDIVVECQIRDQIKALEDETNLPQGVQLWGRKNSEILMLRLARQFEEHDQFILPDYYRS